MEGLRVTAAALVLVMAACTGGGAPPGDPGAIEVQEVGWALAEDRLGAAVRLHNVGEDAVGVLLRVTFVDNAGAGVFSAEGSVPRCEPGGDCWWGHTYPTAGIPAEVVHTAQVEVVGTTPPPEAAANSVGVRRDTEEDIVSDELEIGGPAVVIGFDETGPRWGMVEQVEDGARLLVPRVLLPPIPNERLEAFLYVRAG